MEQVNVAAAVIFYLLFPIGVVVFAVRPAQDAGHAARLGGLLCYATYDLTNLATLKGWPVGITVADIAWRTVVGGVTAVMTGEVRRALASPMDRMHH